MTAEIHPSAIVEDGARLGEGVVIGPYCIVSAQAEIGAGSVLKAHAVVVGRTKLGQNCVLHSHSVLGDLPQVIGFQPTDESRLEVGDNCVFREFTSVHAGGPRSGGLTKIGDNCFMMVGSHIAHDGNFGNNVVLANNASIGGHVEAGDNVWFGGVTAVHQFTRIGRNAFVGGGAILVEDVIPFGSVVGNHATLAGLNVVGLKRRGFSKPQLAEIRSAYRDIFFGEGLFKDRLAAAAETHADKPLAMEIVDFIRKGGDRPICKPA